MTKILITGGSGYIGSHTIVELIETGWEVVCLDNFSNSDGSALDGIEAITGVRVRNYKVDICDKDGLRQCFESEGQIDSVIHFAALKSVGESVEKPLLYFENNISGLINVLEAMEEGGCNQLIFSSSCSVYGDAEALPVLEESPLGEIQSPYARTKIIGEELLREYARSRPDFKVIVLRYFNPAGAHPSNLIGESPTINASNLVPVLTETAIGKRPELVVFGDDYPTRDGTCIRDYIHVSDIAAAHALAADYLRKGKSAAGFDIFNLGSGIGNTVLEVINAFEKTNHQKVNFHIGPRRSGDVIAVYADNKKARHHLGWELQYFIDDIVRTAWNWEKKRSAKAGV